MIDLIIISLILIVVSLLFIIVFLTVYLISERRKPTTLLPLNNEKRIVVPLLTLKTNDRSSGDHSNSAILSATHKRMTKRLRQRVKLHRFLLSPYDSSSSL